MKLEVTTGVCQCGNKYHKVLQEGLKKSDENMTREGFVCVNWRPGGDREVK
jgi:hypothetical protein